MVMGYNGVTSFLLKRKQQKSPHGQGKLSSLVMG